MYGCKSDFLMNQETGKTFGNRDVTASASMFARAMTVASTDHNGTDSVPCTGGNYEHFEFPNTTEFWSDPIAGLSHNLAVIRFIKLVGVSFAKIPEIQFWNAADGGNLLYTIRFDVDEQQDYNENGTLEWEVGGLVVGQQNAEEE